jgi:hypothetical protein
MPVGSIVASKPIKPVIAPCSEMLAVETTVAPAATSTADVGAMKNGIAHALDAMLSIIVAAADRPNSFLVFILITPIFPRCLILLLIIRQFICHY